MNITARGKSKSTDTIRAGLGVLHGKQFSYGSAKEAMVFILRELANADSTFLDSVVLSTRHSGVGHAVYVAQRAADLYPGRPDMINKHDVLPGDWVVGTHLDNRSKMKIIRGAAEVAGITFGRDVIGRILVLSLLDANCPGDNGD